MPAGAGQRRVVAFCPAAAGTSFARVLRATLTEVGAAHEIHELPEEGRGASGELEALRELIARVRPHIVLLLNDPWKIPRYVPVIRAAHPAASIAAWCPIDGDVLNAAVLEFARDIEAFVTCTAKSAAAVSRSLGGAARVRSVGHGVDTRAFYPLAGARERLWPSREDLRDAFLVLNANRNQSRKRLDLTIAGFAAFAKRTRGDTFLVLPSFDRAVGIDLRACAREHGVEHLLLHGPSPTRVAGLDDATLNLIYNACDVGLNTSTGEGFGLIAFEHAATGAAQIMPRHSACEELWDGVAELIETAPPVPDHRCWFSTRTANVASIAEALTRLYLDRRSLADLSARCYEYALAPENSWATVGRQWETLIQELGALSPHAA